MLALNFLPKIESYFESMYVKSRANLSVLPVSTYTNPFDSCNYKQYKIVHVWHVKYMLGTSERRINGNLLHDESPLFISFIFKRVLDKLFHPLHTLCNFCKLKSAILSRHVLYTSNAGSYFCGMPKDHSCFFYYFGPHSDSAQSPGSVPNPNPGSRTEPNPDFMSGPNPNRTRTLSFLTPEPFFTF